MEFDFYFSGENKTQRIAKTHDWIQLKNVKKNSNWICKMGSSCQQNCNARGYGVWLLILFCRLSWHDNSILNDMNKEIWWTEAKSETNNNKYGMQEITNSKQIHRVHSYKCLNHWLSIRIIYYYQFFFFFVFISSFPPRI